MRKLVFIAIGIVSFTSLGRAQAENLFAHPNISLEAGAAPTILFSDMDTQAFGLGLGHQVGLAVSTNGKESMGLKLRLDRYFSRQENMNRAESNYVAPNTRLKSISQQYFLTSVGAEWRQSGAGHLFFYEALLGYAQGVKGNIEVKPEEGTYEITSHSVPLASRFFIMGGVGIKRSFQDKFSLIASARTFFVAGSPYTGMLENRAFIPFPFMLSVGCEYGF